MLLSFVVLIAAHLPCFHAIDLWKTDYHVGYASLGNNHLLSVSNVCNTMISWGYDSFDELSHCESAVCHGRCCSFSATSTIARARALYKSSDHFGASLLLCHNKHLWLPTDDSSVEVALVSSNLLGMSLFESSYFAGSRAAFNLGISLLSQINLSGDGSSTIRIDSFDSADLLMPASAAIFINAARVAVDSWDLNSARNFIKESQTYNLSLSSSDEQASSASEKRAKVSMLGYSKYVFSLPDKPGLLRHIAPLVDHALNLSSIVRAFCESPSDAAKSDALQQVSSWEPFIPDSESNLKYYEWPPHIVEGIINDLVRVIASSASAKAVRVAVGALDGVVGMSLEGQASTHCHIARQSRAIDALLHQLSSSIKLDSELATTAFSALTYLVECDGALSFTTAGGIEVLAAVIRNGSKADRTRAAKLMKSVVKNVASLNGRMRESDSLIAKGYLNRTVLRFTLAMAPLQIYFLQQAGASSNVEDSLIKLLLKHSELFAIYWKQLVSIMSLKQSLLASSTSMHIARELVILRAKHESTHARLAWLHSGARAALVEFFSSEAAASSFVIKLIPEHERLQFNAAPNQPGQTGEYDPIGLLEHFGSEPNHRDVFFHPPCAGIATNLLQCWIFKASYKLPQEECDDSSLVTCHFFNGQKNWVKFPNVSLPDFSTSVDSRHGVMHHHLLDLYFTASLSVYGEWSFLESEMICRHLPVGGTFLDIGAHVGTISIAIAEHVGSNGKVIAVEAQKNFCEMIELTAASNSMPQVSVVHAALDVSNSMCVNTMISSSLALPTNFGGFEVSRCTQYQTRLMITKDQRYSPTPTFYSENGAERAVVNTVTIDAIVKLQGLSSLHAIKLDCEGAEHRALQGGLQSLNRFSPAIFFEDNGISWDLTTSESKPYVPTTENMKELHRGLLQPLGYVCVQHQVSVFNPRNFRGRSENLFGQQSSSVIVCKRELLSKSDL